MCGCVCVVCVCVCVNANLTEVLNTGTQGVFTNKYSSLFRTPFLPPWGVLSPPWGSTPVSFMQPLSANAPVTSSAARSVYLSAG